jgi:DNA invertase Pin-like site-specific DNA recombinase
MTTLHELTALGVGFVSLTEALDLTTPARRTFVGFLTVFTAFEREVIRERITAGIAGARTREGAWQTTRQSQGCRADADVGAARAASSGDGAALRPVEDIRAAGVDAAGGDVRGGSAARRGMGVRKARDV